MKWILISLLLLCAIAVEARPRWRRQCATQCQMQRLTPLQARVLWIKKSDGALLAEHAGADREWPTGTGYDSTWGGNLPAAGPEQYVPAGDPPTAEGVEAPKPNEQLPTPAQPVTDSGEELPPAPPHRQAAAFPQAGDIACIRCDEACSSGLARTAEAGNGRMKQAIRMTQPRGAQDFVNASDLIWGNNGLDPASGKSSWPAAKVGLQPIVRPAFFTGAYSDRRSGASAFHVSITAISDDFARWQAAQAPPPPLTANRAVVGWQQQQTNWP